MDREKVINAVETAFDVWIDDSTGLSWFKEDEARHAKDEVLALLKEQETKLICNLLGGQPYEVYCRECRTVLCILGKGETMNDVKSIFSYCPHCGRQVKWE